MCECGAQLRNVKNLASCWLVSRVWNGCGNIWVLNKVHARSNKRVFTSLSTTLYTLRADRHSISIQIKLLAKQYHYHNS